MSYALNHIHSSKSLLDGFGKTDDIAKRAKELDLNFISISDHGNCGNHYDFIKSLKKHGIRGSVGIEFYISHEPAAAKLNRYNTHFVCWAKNEQGVKDIWKACTYANEPFNFYYKPRISLKNWINPEDNKEYYGLEHFVKDGNCIGINGHWGTLLSNCLFADYDSDPKEREAALDKAFNTKKGLKSDHFEKLLIPNWLESCSKYALMLQDIFGKGNFAIELQDAVSEKDKVPLYITETIVKCLRQVSKETGIPAVCSDDPHYVYEKDARNQKVMVMLNLKEDEASVQKQIDDQGHDTMVFFTSDNFYIHDYEYMKTKYTEEEIQNGIKLNEGIKLPNLDKQPYMPSFEVPDFPIDQSYLNNIEKKEDKFLMYLAVEGAKRTKPWLISKKDKELYWNRLKSETEIIFKFNLSNYFLVVWDVCMAADNRPKDHSYKWSTAEYKRDPITRGVGRGSAAGCLLSYFTDITGLDPIAYDLLFSRFLNAGRFTKDHISLPDVDIDFEPSGREWIIEYLKSKYGEDKVSHIITFGKIKGRNAIKDIFRIKGIENGFEIANKICEFIPDEATISDEIQEMKDAGDKEYGIIEWAIDNKPELAEYYKEYKEIFDQAMELENIERSAGKHPSGIVLTPIPTQDCFPMCFDTKTKTKIIGVDYKNVESMGGCKLDILGVSILGKLKYVENLYNKSKINE